MQLLAGMYQYRWVHTALPQDQIIQTYKSVSLPWVRKKIC